MTNQLTLFDQVETKNTLKAYMLREAKRMWPNPEHCKRSMAQVQKFIDWRNHSDFALNQFTAEDVDDFAEHLVATGSKEATANRYLASITKVFNHARRKRVLVHAPRPTFFKTKSERIRYFSNTEIAQMLSFFRGRGDWWMADMVTLALKTGMRKGEIVALGEGRAKISLCGNWINLPAEVTKTSKERNVAINNEEAHRAAHRLADALGRHYTKKAFEYRWGLLKREYARADDTYVFHVTRHNAASRMANELEVPTVIIADFLGHASLATTQRYVHSKPTTMLDISARM